MISLRYDLFGATLQATARLLLCGCALWIAVGAAAQDDDIVEQITVLGTRIPIDVEDAPEHLEFDEIQRRNSATLIELLRDLPGIGGIAPGGAGGITEIYLRGADANFTTVLIDGIRVNDPTDARGGGFDFAALSPGEVQRIEVVRGPYSALYGSGALAGAINIVTAAGTNRDRHGHIRAALGSDSFWNVGASIFGDFARGRASLSAHLTDFGDEPVGSTRQSASIGAAYDVELSSGWSLKLQARANDGDRSAWPIAGGGPRLSATDALERGESESLSAAARLGWEGERAAAQLAVSWLNREEDTDSPGLPDGVFPGVPASVAATDFERLSVVLQTRFVASDAWALVAGVEIDDDTGNASGAFDFGGFQVPTDFAADRETVSPFAEARWSVSPRLQLFAGLRHDDFSDVDDATSPRVGFSVESGSGGSSLRGSWGRGRKAPSFYALGDPLIGNPALAPEDSEGVDMQWSTALAGGSVRLGISAYRYEYENLIDFDFSSFSLVNRSTVKTRGAEVELEGGDSHHLAWRLYVAAHRNEVDGVDDGLLHRPKTTAGVSVDWRINGNWSMFAAGTFEDKRPSSSVPGGFETLPSVVRFDISLRRSFNENRDLALSIDNVLDRRWEAVAGIPSPGRRLRLALMQRF